MVALLPTSKSSDPWGAPIWARSGTGSQCSGLRGGSGRSTGPNAGVGSHEGVALGPQDPILMHRGRKCVLMGPQDLIPLGACGRE